MWWRWRAAPASPIDMERFDKLSREVPVLANVRPSGKYLMEDFFYAGGLRALMAGLKDRLDLSCLTVNGRHRRREHRGRRRSTSPT